MRASEGVVREDGPPRASEVGVYQYPASGRDMDTLRPVAGNAFDPRFPPPAAVRANDRGASATGWLVGLGSFAAVLLIGVGAMVNMNHANAASAAAAALPNALTATPVPVLPETEPVVPTQAAPVAAAPVAAAPVAAAPPAEEPPAPVAPTGATARKIKKPQPQRHVTAAPVTRPTPAPAAITRPAPALPPRTPADASATKEAQETLIKAMAERPLN